MNHFTKLASIAILLMSFCLRDAGAVPQERPLTQCVGNIGTFEEETLLALEDTLLSFDGELRWALTADDPTYLTLLADYPLRVNDNGDTMDIANAGTLYSNSDAVFPEVLRNRVLDTDLADLICRQDSGGIGYGNGSLWIYLRTYGDTERFAIGVVNLPRVQAENSRGIEFTCQTTEFRSVIDRSVDGTLRFRSWNTPRLLSEAPDLELFPGRRDVEGTGVCAHEIFRFEDEDATYRLSALGCSADPPPDDAVGSFLMSTGEGETTFHWCF